MLYDQGEGRALWEVWPGKNRVYCEGKVMMGADVIGPTSTLLATVIPSAAYMVWVVGRMESSQVLAFGFVSGLLFLLALFFFVATTTSDPGILPRRLLASLELRKSLRELPKQKVYKVDGYDVESKWCDTCLLYRPPRCSHCSVCNNCVQRFDHHCPWLGTCIGERNYKFFLLFVLSVTLYMVSVIAGCAVALQSETEDEKTFAQAVSAQPVALVLLLYCGLLVWFPLGLFFFHLYLLSKGKTTYENFRLQGVNHAFHRGLCGNLADVCTVATPLSLVHLRKNAHFTLKLFSLDSVRGGGDDEGEVNTRKTSQASRSSSISDIESGEAHVLQNRDRDVQLSVGAGALNMDDVDN